MSRLISRREFTLTAASSLGTAAVSSAPATARASTAEGNFDAYEAPRGGKQFVYVNVWRSDAVNVDLPVGVVTGERDGPTLAVTGGIFGTEYCGIEAASRLYRDLGPQTMAGRVIILPVVNMPAFQFRTPMFNLSGGNNPIDGKSVNTVFPGDPNGSVSEVIAHFVFDKLVRKADYFIDLRGGDLPENHLVHTMFASEGSERVQQVSRRMALACGFRYYQSRSQRPGSLFWEAAKAGVPAIITQSGLGYKTQPEESFIQNHVRGVTNIMKHFGMMDGDPVADGNQEELSPEFVTIKSGHSGIFHATGEPGDLVEKGNSIGRITRLDGSVAEEIPTQRDGVLHTLFVRRVVMQGDTVAYVVPLAQLRTKPDGG